MFSSLLWQRVDIYSQTLDLATPNSVGGFSRTAALKHASVPCNVQWFANMKQVPLFGKANIPAEMIMFIQADYALTSTDLVYLPWENKYYEILFIEDCFRDMWSISKARHYQVYLKNTSAPQIVTPQSSSSESSGSSNSSSSSSSNSSSSSSE
jgi:hypothetical protein